MIKVLCLDNSKVYGFSANTPYEALEKMRYTLDVVHKDERAVINKTKSGRCLYMEHSGKTYGVRI